MSFLPPAVASRGAELSDATRSGAPQQGADPLVAALVRYVEALHRRYPEGPEQMRRAGLDGRAKITRMSDRRKGTAS